MYIIKNALRSIARSKGRNILIGIIIFVIATATCIALSIMQAAETAKKGSLDLINITAQISYDRQKQMENFTPPETQSGETQQPPEMDKDAFKQMLNGNSLSIDELQTYSKAESVKNFYYTVSSSLNATDEFEAISSSNGMSESVQATPSIGNDNKGSGGKGINQGDFTIVGYSSDDAMTNFKEGICKITSGEMFEEQTEKLECIISDELAALNSIAVGDVIKFVNPNNENETFEITVKGIYNNSASTQTNTGGYMFMQDPANQIFMSANALIKMKESSDLLVSNTDTSNEDNQVSITSIPTQTTGTYVFENMEKYEAFEAQAKALGLSDTYTVSSQDVNSFEQSLQPLENLSNFALYFLIIVLAIGAIILIVLNIFNVRERKYEIGVFTAIGMNKIKVCCQFVTELFVITIISIFLGTAVGAVSSVPVANTLLQSQIASNQQSSQDMQMNFGRPTDGNSKNNSFKQETITNNTENTITEITSATNLAVVAQLMGIGILLTLIASFSAVIFVMRYEPLKILTNRD
ncbi:MAG: ABC transporter permease [Oscillospiraceae bacterium]